MQLQPGEKIKTVWESEPMRIVELLFDKLLLHTGRARSALSGWGDESCQSHIIEAVEVIEKLRITVDTASGNALAHNLDDLYSYIAQRLLCVAQEQNVTILNDVMSLLHEIRSMLAQFVKKSPDVLQH